MLQAGLSLTWKFTVKQPILRIFRPPAGSAYRTRSQWICLGRRLSLAAKIFRNLSHPLDLSEPAQTSGSTTTRLPAAERTRILDPASMNWPSVTTSTGTPRMTAVPDGRRIVWAMPESPGETEGPAVRPERAGGTDVPDCDCAARKRRRKIGRSGR